MTEVKKPFRNFYVPAVHLGSSEFSFTPPKATDPEQVVLRKTLGQYSARFLDQKLGLDIVRKMLDIEFRDPAAETYIHNRVAVALYNTAWYNFQLAFELSGNDVMNKVVKLPILAEDEGEERFRTNRGYLLALARHDLGAAAVHAEALISELPVENREAQKKRVAARSANIGVCLGEASLKLAVLGLTQDYGDRSAVQIQSDVRQVGLNLVENSRSIGGPTSNDPSLAFLARAPIDRALAGTESKEARSVFAGARQQLSSR